jgi:hypothetical protein
MEVLRSHYTPKIGDAERAALGQYRPRQRLLHQPQDLLVEQVAVLRGSVLQLESSQVPAA